MVCGAVDGANIAESSWARRAIRFGDGRRSKYRGIEWGVFAVLNRRKDLDSALVDGATIAESSGRRESPLVR
jgi:hypothetical protein